MVTSQALGPSCLRSNHEGYGYKIHMDQLIIHRQWNKASPNPVHIFGDLLYVALNFVVLFSDSQPLEGEVGITCSLGSVNKVLLQAWCSMQMCWRCGLNRELSSWWWNYLRIISLLLTMFAYLFGKLISVIISNIKTVLKARAVSCTPHNTCAHEVLPYAFNISVFNNGNSNPTTIKHIYNESENLNESCDICGCGIFHKQCQWLAWRVWWHALAFVIWPSVTYTDNSMVDWLDVISIGYNIHLLSTLTANQYSKWYFTTMYSISQEICTQFLLCCALLWLYIDWFSHIHQAYFTGTVAI